MELTAISEVLQTISGGALSAFVLVAGFLAWRFGPTYFKQRDREIKARERDNKLRKIHIRLMVANLTFLKEQGHDLQIPDITEDL